MLPPDNKLYILPHIKLFKLASYYLVKRNIGAQFKERNFVASEVIASRNQAQKYPKKEELLQPK